jgi:peptide/nickel transport system substrate-binding protein
MPTRRPAEPVPPNPARPPHIERIQGQMRKKHLGLVSSLAAFVLMACASAASAKDTLVLGLPVEPTGLDPTIAAPVAIREVTWGNVYEGLTTIDKDGKVQPLLAKEWTISPDGLTYTFKLQPDVKFHNGTPFDSSIVKFSLDRARAPDSTNAQKQFFEPIAGIETPDPLTAVIKLKHPVGLFTYWLAWGDAVMIDPKTVATNKTAPIGTGPFKFKDWQRGDRVDLVKNPDYWQKGLPKLASVTMRFIGDSQAQAAALRAGDVDAIPNFTAPELFGEFQKDARFKAVIGVTPRKLVAALNNQKSPLNDVRVRQAMMSAIDRKAVIEGAYSGYGTPIGSHFAPTDPGYIDLTSVLPYDPAKAKKLLAEAGYPNGFTVTIKTPQMSYTTHSAEVMQAMLAEVGITLNIVTCEFHAKWIDEVFLKKDYEVSIIDHAEPMDIDIYSRPTYYFGYHNPKFDALIAQAESTPDDAARAKIYGEAEKILAVDVPALYLFDLPRLGIWSTKLEGLWPNEPISEVMVRDVHWDE